MGFADLVCRWALCDWSSSVRSTVRSLAWSITSSPVAVTCTMTLRRLAARSGPTTHQPDPGHVVNDVLRRWPGRRAAHPRRRSPWAARGVLAHRGGHSSAPVMVAPGNWGLAHRPGERRLRVRAELLRDGGPELVAAMIDELRELHLGVLRPDRDAPRAGDQLRAAYKTALRDKTSSEPPRNDRRRTRRFARDRPPGRSQHRIRRGRSDRDS